MVAIRSASLITTARTSFTMASSIRRTLSTCSSVALSEVSVCKERIASISFTESKRLEILSPNTSPTDSRLIKPLSKAGYRIDT